MSTHLTTVNSLSLFADRGNRTRTILAFLACSWASHSLWSNSFNWIADGESRSIESTGDGGVSVRRSCCWVGWGTKIKFILSIIEFSFKIYLIPRWGGKWRGSWWSSMSLSSKWWGPLLICASSRCTWIGTWSSSCSDSDVIPIKSGSVIVGAQPSVKIGW